MKRLILTSGDSSAGCIKAARVADKVIGVGLEMLMLPAFLTKSPHGFVTKWGALLEPRHYGFNHFTDGGLRTGSQMRKLRATARAHDRIEIWCDPDPHGQLRAMFILDWLGSDPQSASKLALCHADQCLGQISPEEVRNWQPTIISVERQHLATASKVWSAYRQPTPVSWCALLRDQDILVFPYLRSTIVKLLRELPSQENGLTWTEQRILSCTDAGSNTPRQLFADLYSAEDRSPFGYWALGHILCSLAMCEQPALEGVTEREFVLEFHDDKERFDAFMSSAIHVTPFGGRLLEGLEDFAGHNTIDYWWGGTRVTNDRLWRWNEEDQFLLAPATV